MLASSTGSGTARSQQARYTALLPPPLPIPSPAQPRPCFRRLRSGLASSSSPPSLLRPAPLPPALLREPPVASSELQPSRPLLRERLPACIGPASSPVAAHPQTPGSPPLPAPNTRPNYARPQRLVLLRPGAAIPATPPHSSPPAPVACSQLASNPPRAPQNRASKSKTPLPHPLPQRSPALPQTVSPVPAPYPGIVTPARGTNTQSS